MTVVTHLAVGVAGFLLGLCCRRWVPGEPADGVYRTPGGNLRPPPRLGPPQKSPHHKGQPPPTLGPLS